MRHLKRHNCIRCVVNNIDDTYIHVTSAHDIVLPPQTAEAGDKLLVDYNTSGYTNLTFLRDIIREGMQLNLLDYQVTTSHNSVTVIHPLYVIIEPDYLLDISSIANCFEQYGHHPLLYTVNRLKARPNNKYTLIGNFAGSALDDIINNTGNYDYRETLKTNFREKALEFSTCDDLDTEDFKKEAMRQAANLQQIVKEIFLHADRDKAILEPTFICEALGLQGRVDLMTTDLRLLVEQKAGKNIFLERQYKNRYGGWHVEKHYVQVLLYDSILTYNFQVAPSHADIKLLYSRYPLPGGLLNVPPLQKLTREALKFRNEVVAMEYNIAREGFEKYLDMMTPETLNTEGCNDNFYSRYLLPDITKTITPLHNLSPIERAYLCRMMTFVIREQITSKTGGVLITDNSNKKRILLGRSSTADSWNMSLTEKRDMGNIYVGLRVIKKEQSIPGNGFDTITLAITEQGDDFLPNFRRGDMVCLYSYGECQENPEPDIRQSILFKGVIAELHSDQITIHLNDGQKNDSVFDSQLSYAIEHGNSDAGSNAAIQGLYNLITSEPSRKALLLGQRRPRKDASQQLTRSYHPTYDNIILKAKQAQDYFLLVGPPGTGKTSMALRFLVEEELASKPHPSILLLSYTNRAVDEICSMLYDADIEFIRLGNEYSCEPKYRKILLAHAVEECPKLSSIKEKLLQTKVIVSTTASLMSRPFILQLRSFTLAITDEAGQILEPNIIGLLSAKDKHGLAAIERFILIGDYKQLPAVVQQTEKESEVTEPLLRDIHLYNCRQSLFERLLKTEKAAKSSDFIGVLQKQGRMHPAVAAFPSQAFYQEEQLQPVPLQHQLEQDFGYEVLPSDDTDELLSSRRTLFIPSMKCEQEGLSDKVNTDEACIVAEVLRRIHRFYGKNFNSSKTVGVIVPYRNQIAMIRKEIEKVGIPELTGISIDTVERYQGSQRDIIIFSFTVQQSYQLEFLTSNTFEEDGNTIDRKLNVAITRARKQLILTGNEELLRQVPLYRHLIDACTKLTLNKQKSK